MDRYGWRHQIRPWVQAGYRVIAPDMLGYGQTDKPSAIAGYTSKKLADDLAALLDTVRISKVVRIAHPAVSLFAIPSSKAYALLRLSSAMIGVLLL
jgi:pimeloyl-ACP methyl ester carboxylesterase